MIYCNIIMCNQYLKKHINRVQKTNSFKGGQAEMDQRNISLRMIKDQYISYHSAAEIKKPM